ncbi:MAG: RNA helicase [Hyphomonas sp.]|uniref:AAA family ATPase n=1 Tax=Hyphomonas sp. TaxID=87 RepID=UPI001D9DDB39|nr:AAA family ATPase [Hyphomonas sp.]MBA4226227.1 RNA helicase [Hyphomonas sp.]
MIEIIGVNEGKEFEAAVQLRKRIIEAWPHIAQSRDDLIKIFVGLKLYGYRIEDIDLLVVGQLATPTQFDTECKFTDRAGETYVPRRAAVKNFLLVIEVKSHDPSGVRFDDKIASVRYIRSGRPVWESVTEKNRQQMFEFKKYLADCGIEKIYAQDLIYFTGLRESDLPKRPHNCFGTDASFERVLNILGQIASPHRRDRDALIAFGPDDVFAKLTDGSVQLLQSIEPTAIDRKRMDRIAKAALPVGWLDDIGRKQVLVRGRGGVGKTVLLLQMAYRTFDKDLSRSLILTFNKALVADMRRTMALMGVPKSIEHGGISIETIHGFIGRVMIELGVMKSYDGFLENYDAQKAQLLQYLTSKAISDDDLTNLLQSNAAEFHWDAIFVDEGQDWPSDEIEILRFIYGSHRIIVADGVDQYVRSSVADWFQGVASNERHSHRLHKCLRMKANLTAFVSDLAAELELNGWELEPNLEANGGRVLIVEGDIARDTAFVEQVCAEAHALGNYPIDLLACVPPMLVSVQNTEAPSVLGHAMLSHGLGVWDGSSVDVREKFPTDRDALRIVQYDSCRGLEGWTVINYAFDEFIQYKIAQAHGLDGVDPIEFASRWAMIPLTRAMDRLIINVSKSPSHIKEALAAVHKRREDFVDWITV